MPDFVCEVCGEAFYEQGVMVRHVKRCVKKNRDSIEKLVAARRRDPLEHAIDHEAVEWQRKKHAHLLGR